MKIRFTFLISLQNFSIVFMHLQKSSSVNLFTLLQSKFLSIQSYKFRGAATKTYFDNLQIIFDKVEIGRLRLPFHS